MRRFIAFVLLCPLLTAGCGSSSSKDIAAAREYVKSSYSNPAIDFSDPAIEFKVDKVEGPEYAKIERIPRERVAEAYPDRSAACAVRVWFTWRAGGRTVHDSWIVWVSKDHKGVGISDPSGGEWRKWVQSLAKNPPAQISVTPSTVSYQPEPVPNSAAREPKPAKAAAPSRLWTMADGSAMMRATFLSLSGNRVKLRKWDGMVISVPLNQLIQADRDWIEANQEQL